MLVFFMVNETLNQPVFHQPPIPEMAHLACSDILSIVNVCMSELPMFSIT